MAIGNCEFLWVRTGESKRNTLEVMLEEVMSGRPYLATTDAEGYYFLANIPPGVYLLRRIKFHLTDTTVEHEPDTKLFVMLQPGRTYYLGKLVVEVDRTLMRKGMQYSAYEKHISGDLRTEDIRDLIARRKGDSEWLNREIVPENALERF